MAMAILSFLILLCGFALGASQVSVLDEVPLIDGHNDLPYNLYSLNKNNLSDFHFERNLTTDPKWGVKNCPSCFTDLPRLREGKVGAQFWVAYVACSTQYKDSLAKTLEQIDVIKRLIERYPNNLEFVKTADGIMSAFKNKKIASLIGIEGGHSMDSRLGVLRMLYDLGARYMTLTHTCNTPWADNSYVDDNKTVHNLTEYGKLIVKEMNRIGMMVDLSHVSHQVMNDAIAVSRAPVIFSHSSAYEVHKHNRNVRDDTLKLLKKNDGIVMVNFFPEFISPNPQNASIHDVIAHINYIAEVAGVDHVGIGADYDGVSKQPKGLEDVSKYPKIFELLQTKFPHTWTRENLKKLAGENLLRVFRAVENVSSQLKSEPAQESWIPLEDLNAVSEEEKLWQCRTTVNNVSPKTRGISSGYSNLKPFSLLLYSNIVYRTLRFLV